MIIRNVSSGVISISDLPGGQTGESLTLQPGGQVTIFNQHAQESAQLASFITAGLIQNLGSAEPTTGTSVGMAEAAASSSGIVLGGDLSGNAAAAVVAKVKGVTLGAAPAAGQYLKASSAAAAAWTTPASADLSDVASLIKNSTALGGDMSGLLPNPSVAKINGVALGAAPAAGQYLKASSAIAAAWAVPSSADLSDAASLIKTTSTLAGDLSGTPVAATVAKINGVTLGAAPAAGQYLKASSASAASWVVPASADLSDAASLIKNTTVLGGDLSGSLPNPSVAKVNGIAVSGTPVAGQVLTASSGTAAAWAALPASSAVGSWKMAAISALAGVTHYSSPVANSSATELAAQVPCPSASTLKAFKALLTGAAAAGSSAILAVRKNGVNVATINVPALQASGSVLDGGVLAIAFAAGDLFDFSLVEGVTGSGVTYNLSAQFA